MPFLLCIPQLRDITTHMAPPTEGCGIHFLVAKLKSAPPVVMSPLCDLILQGKGKLQTETVQVVDIAQA